MSLLRRDNSPVVLPKSITPVKHHVRRVDGVECLAYELQTFRGLLDEPVLVARVERSDGIGTLPEFKAEAMGRLMRFCGPEAIALLQEEQGGATTWTRVTLRRKDPLLWNLWIGGPSQTIQTKTVTPHKVRAILAL